MTVKDLRDALTLMAARYDNCEVYVDMRGTRMHVERLLGVATEIVLLEASIGMPAPTPKKP